MTECLMPSVQASRAALCVRTYCNSWRPDETDLTQYFGEPRVTIDMVTGLNKGFLANVDYRMYTDNINWDALQNVQGHSFHRNR